MGEILGVLMDMEQWIAEWNKAVERLNKEALMGAVSVDEYLAAWEATPITESSPLFDDFVYEYEGEKVRYYIKEGTVGCYTKEVLQ